MSLIALQCKEESGVVFPAIRRARRKQIMKRKAEYKWGEPDYKIYPSSIKSWSFCPKEFIPALANYSGIEDIDAYARVRRGTAVHTELQSDFVNSDIIYDKPNISNKHVRMTDKLLAGWPEVPFHDLDSGISGSLDGVILYKGSPAIIDFKTTSKNPETWEDLKNAKSPETVYSIQLAIYAYMVNKLNYYDKPVEHMILCYENMLMTPGAEDSQYEKVLDYSKYKDKITTLIEQLIIHRDAFITGKDIPCQSPLCKKHKGGE